MSEKKSGLPPEVLAGIGVLGLFMVILIPLPSLVLDLLLVGNMVLAFLMVVLAVSVEDRRQLSAFPTLLLGMTLGRLALNVASTRLILTQGEAFGGVLVRAFGSWVLGGSYAVGVVLFGILVAIQYFVVAKGSERVAEVAARFRLDGLPLQQMGIEARVQDKALTRDEATRERARLQQESDFFGAMDGASKFVKGETMAGMLVTAINFVGGVVLGVVAAGMSPGEAMQTFCLLTVGDGLVGLVPSMMVALAAGLVITRTEGEGALSARVTREFFQNTPAVGVAAAAVGLLMTLFGLFSGVNPLGFLVLAASCFAAAGIFFSLDAEPADPSRAEAAVEVEVSEATRGALEAAFPGARGLFLQAAGDRLYRERGVRVETPRLGVAAGLEDGAFRVRIRGLEAGGGTLDPSRWLAIHPGGDAPGERLPGEPDADPVGKRPAMLIAPDAVGRALELGYEVMDPGEVLAARVSNLLLEGAAELMGVQETEEWLREAGRRYPAVLREIEGSMGVVEVQGALEGLLAEGVSIRAQVRILEALSRRHSLRGQSLVEAVRAEIGGVIATPLVGADGVLRCLGVAPALEVELKQQVTVGEDGGEFLAVDPDLAGDLLSGARARADGLRGRGLAPTLIVSRKLRPHLFRLLARVVPDLRVLAYEEAEGVEVRVEAHLDRFPRPGEAASGEGFSASA